MLAINLFIVYTQWREERQKSSSKNLKMRPKIPLGNAYAITLYFRTEKVRLINGKRNNEFRFNASVDKQATEAEAEF